MPLLSQAFNERKNNPEGLVELLKQANESNLGREMTDEETQQLSQIAQNPQLQQQMAAQQQQEKMAQVNKRIGKAMQDLHLPANPQSAQSVLKAVADGRPLQPQALISRRRDKIRKQIDDVKHSLTSEFELQQMKSKVKEIAELEAKANVSVDPKDSFGKAMQKNAQRRLAEAKADLNPLTQQRAEFLNARLAGFQQQLLALDGLENQVSLAEGLDGADYQNAITQLLTGQQVKTATVEEKEAAKQAALEKDREFAADRSDKAFDQLRDLKSDARSERQMDINQQLADARTLEGKAAETTAAGIGKAGEGEIDKQLITLEKSFSQVSDLAQKFDVEAFTFQDKIARLGVQTLDKLNLSNPEHQAYLEKRRIQEQTINSIFNSYRKLITGAAASEKELEDLQKSILNPNLSPSDARASLRSLMVNIVRDQQILKDLKINGISNSDAIFDSAFTAKKLEFDANMREAIEKQIIDKYPNLAPADPNAKREDLKKRLIQVMKENGEPIPAGLE